MKYGPSSFWQTPWSRRRDSTNGGTGTVQRQPPGNSGVGTSSLESSSYDTTAAANLRARNEALQPSFFTLDANRAETEGQRFSAYGGEDMLSLLAPVLAQTPSRQGSADRSLASNAGVEPTASLDEEATTTDSGANRDRRLCFPKRTAALDSSSSEDQEGFAITEDFMDDEQRRSAICPSTQRHRVANSQVHTYPFTSHRRMEASSVTNCSVATSEKGAKIAPRINDTTSTCSWCSCNLARSGSPVSIQSNLCTRCINVTPPHRVRQQQQGAKLQFLNDYSDISGRRKSETSGMLVDDNLSIPSIGFCGDSTVLTPTETATNLTGSKHRTTKQISPPQTRSLPLHNGLARVHNVASEPDTLQNKSDVEAGAGRVARQGPNPLRLLELPEQDASPPRDRGKASRRSPSVNMQSAEKVELRGQDRTSTSLVPQEHSTTGQSRRNLGESTNNQAKYKAPKERYHSTRRSSDKQDPFYESRRRNEGHSTERREAATSNHNESRASLGAIVVENNGSTAALSRLSARQKQDCYLKSTHPRHRNSKHRCSKHYESQHRSSKHHESQHRSSKHYESQHRSSKHSSRKHCRRCRPSDNDCCSFCCSDNCRAIRGGNKPELSCCNSNTCCLGSSRCTYCEVKAGCSCKPSTKLKCEYCG